MGGMLDPVTRANYNEEDWSRTLRRCADFASIEEFDAAFGQFALDTAN